MRAINTSLRYLCYKVAVSGYESNSCGQARPGRPGGEMNRVRGLAVAVLVAGVAAVCAAAGSFVPIARVQVGAQSGMVLSAAGSVWTSDFALGGIVRIDPA